MVHYDFMKQVYGKSEFIQPFIGKEDNTYERCYALAYTVFKSQNPGVDAEEDKVQKHLAWVADTVFHYLAMEEHGKNIFVITPDISKAFNMTDVRVPPELVKVPFKEFFLHLEEASDIKIIGSDGKPKPVTGMYVNFDNTKVRVLLTYGPNAQLDDQTFYFNFDLVKGENVVETIDRWLKATRFNGVTAEGNKAGIQENVINEVNDSAVADSVSYILNFLLYINTNTTGIRHQGSKRNVDIHNPKAVKKLKNPTDSYVVIGSTFKLNSAKSGNGNYRIEKKFWVRGHWRNQPCGEGLKDRKLIFIEPFIKGKEFEGRERIYKVK